MNTLIIDRKGLSISQERDAIKIDLAGARPRTIPLSQFKRIVISSNVQIESRLLRSLAARNISLVLVNPRRPDDYGLLVGSGHKDARRRIKQYKASEDIDFCIAFARDLVRDKIVGQKTVIDDGLKNHPADRFKLLKASRALAMSMGRLEETSLNLDSIRGIEGASASTYFGAYTCLVPEKLGFTHRNRRPPRDPVNALLSLSYTMASSLAGTALQTHGLDLLIGFYHKLSYSRQSLCADVIEPVRPIVDAWVAEMVCNKKLDAGHFCLRPDGCYLSKEGRGIYYATWERDMRLPVVDKLDQVVRNLESRLEQFP